MNVCKYRDGSLIVRDVFLLCIHTSIEGNKVERVEIGKIVSTVYINGLQQSNPYPGPHQDKMVGEYQDTEEESKSQN